MCRWTTGESAVKLGLGIVALWTILCPKRKGKEEVTRTWKELASYRKLLWGEQWSLIGDIASLNYLSRREPGGYIPWSPSLILSNFMLEPLLFGTNQKPGAWEPFDGVHTGFMEQKTGKRSVESGYGWGNERYLAHSTLLFSVSLPSWCPSGWKMHVPRTGKCTNSHQVHIILVWHQCSNIAAWN